MVTFQEAASFLAKQGAGDDENETMRDFFIRIKQGNFLLDGIPVEVSPAELFRQTSPQLTHALYFRLQSVEPLTFVLAAVCFDGDPMEVQDFVMVLTVAIGYIMENADDASAKDDVIDLRPIFKKYGPVDGGLLVATIPGDPDEELDAIGVCHPQITGRTNRAMMYAVLKAALFSGFSSK